MQLHRGLDVQPHAVAEELIDLILGGAGDLADVRAEALVGGAHVLADRLVVAGGVCLELEHQLRTVGGEQLDVAVADRTKELDTLIGAPRRAPA